jgi:hypothetical protein
MKNVRRLRARGSLCRQQAAYNPAQSWKLLAEAEYWEHLAQAETSSHFIECNTTSSVDPNENPAQHQSRMTPDSRSLSPRSWEFRSRGKPSPPSDHTPLRRRCAF